MSDRPVGFEKADTVTTEIPTISMEVDRWVLNVLSVTVVTRSEEHEQILIFLN